MADADRIWRCMILATKWPLSRGSSNGDAELQSLALKMNDGGLVPLGAAG
jgi:hypothetical protein